MKKWLATALAAGLGGLLGGCLSVGPDYEQPASTLPDAWHAAVVDEVAAGGPGLQEWWQVV